MLVLKRTLRTGSTQKLYRFPNNYGASVVKGPYTYGGPEDLWELAVIKFNSEDNTDYDLCYDTAITEDVIGHLTDGEVKKLLTEIEAL